ncbi:zinc carboxypeptidase [Virgisporangium aliadipatigenens]|uniref:Zinc carboxypeptidase n=1 Tax=Virgisporangium aliadipatigenens TaxID=741659 RepID=A0A8J4DML3_9ACTN|nr:M14 family zinc carboxypeptidase [Virgisporangium aliadipatigenens]GIJ43915.1 zinc carboxypeptidase [Virgisporangium aliadipatigenens]
MIDELSEVIRSVPSADRFPTVDELAASVERLRAEHPDIITEHRIGTSRLGEPLSAMRVGDGPRHAIVFGGVHPNEPVGGLTAVHLVRTLAADAGLRARLGFTWHVIPCIDPDGMRLNEGWFAGPLSWGSYGRAFYRPAPDEQVEWTFPLRYKRAWFDRVLPETLALMRLIDDTRPALLCSLHNGEYGGVFYYLSRPEPELYDTLTAIPARLGLPLHTGEPEAPCIANYAPGVYGTINVADEYDYLESHGIDPVGALAGDSSAAYAARYGALTLVSEVPYWAHTDADDPAPTAVPYAQLLRERVAAVREVYATLQSVLSTVEGELSVGSPFLRACRSFVPSLDGLATREAERAADPAHARPATVAERFSGEAMLHQMRIRFGGMLLRAIEGEFAIGHATPVLRRQYALLSRAYDAWALEAETTTTPHTVPIGDLVAIQYAAILATAVHLRDAGRSTST